MHSEYMDTLGVCDDAQACLDVMGDIHDKTSQALSQSRSSSRAIWRNSFAIAAGSTLKRDKSSVHPTILASSGHQLRYNLWLGIRMALQDQRGSISEESDKLQAERKSFTDFPKKVLDFRYKHSATESEMDAVSAILDEYHDILDLYPSRRALEEDMTGFSLPRFLTRIDALQSWQNIWCTARVVFERLEYLKANNPYMDPNVSLDSQPVEFFLHAVTDPLHKLRYTSFSTKDIQQILPKLFDEISLNDRDFQDMNLTEHLVDIRLVLLGNAAFEALSAVAFASHLYAVEKTGDEEVICFAFEIVKKIDTALAMRRMSLTYIPDLKPSIFQQSPERKIGEAVLKFVEFMKHRIVTFKPIKLFRLLEFMEHLWPRMPEIGLSAPSLMCHILNELCQLELLFIDMLQSLIQQGASAVKSRPVDILRRPLIHLFEFIVMLRSYSAKTAEVRGQLVPEALLFQKLQEEDFALVDTSLSDSCIFASPGLWGSKENIRSFTEAAAQCMYDSGLDTDAGAYIVIFYKLDLKDWPGRRISLKSDYFKCLQGNSDVLFRILPDAAFEQAPYITWVSSLDSILRKASLLNKIAKSGQMVASDTVSLAIATIKLTETQLSQVTTSADVKVVQRTFLFLSAYGVSLSELIGAKHKDYTKLSVTLFLLATKWAIFSYKKHRILSLPNMKSAASQALDFVLAMSSDSKLLDLLSEEEYISFSGSASMCLGNIIAPDAIFPSPDTTSSEPMLKHAFISNKVPRQQRVRAEIERLDDSRSVHGTSGRVLDSSLNTMDRNLARLSSEAPKARVKWQRGRFINKGAMGSVYLASNLDTGTYMAVKEIFFKEEKEVEQLRRNEHILRMLHHPNITMYYGAEIHRDRIFLLMEYCPGSLETILKQGRIEDEDIIRNYASQMVRGLHYLHSLGIMHHDVKPSNILFDQHGTLKFVDFGCAELKIRNAIVEESNSFKLVGTARFLPPEVIRNEPNAPLSSHDVWAFGCTIIQMATGKVPWYEYDNEWAVMFQLGLGKLPTLPSAKELSSVGVDFVKHCLTESAFERPTSAQLLDHEWLRHFYG